MELKLPLGLIGQADAARLGREINSLDDFFVSAAARRPGSSLPPPRLSRLLDQLAAVNQCNLLEATERKKLGQALKNTIDNAPLLHISFAAEPPPKALEKILSWLRSNIHPQTLLQVGLQPTIAAGCVLRTPNRQFDMSLRNYLKTQEPYLISLIKGAVRGD